MEDDVIVDGGSEEVVVPDTPEEVVPEEGSEENMVPKEEETYQADFKYKANGEEKEFDEWLRGAVKSKEHEEQLRDLYSKANGLDSVNQSFDSFREEVDPILQDYSVLQEIEQRVQHFINNNDMNSLQQELGLSNEQILKHAKDILDYQDMDPGKRAELDSQRKVQEQNMFYEQQQQALFEQQEQMGVQNRELTLNMELMKEDVSSFREKFDAAAGIPNAFQNAVISTGQQAFNQYGIDLSAAEAVGLVMKDYAGFINNMGAGTPQVQEQTNIIPVEKPVIPNMGGGGSKSPAKRAINSIDDLKKLRQSRGLG